MSIPLSTPKQIPCRDCRARANTACSRVKPGRKIEVQYLKGFHAARRAEYQRIIEANPQATTDTATHPGRTS